MNKIIKAVKLFRITYLFQIFGQEHRKKWDKNLLKYEVIKIKNENVVLTYQLNKAPLNFQNRDFVDKQIKFSHNNKFYVYYTSIPNHEEIKEIPDKVGRAQNYIGIQKLERLENEGKIKLTMLM